MKIAVTGATGQLGQITITKLKEKTNAENLVALVRNTDKAKDLGVEVRHFDYTKTESQEEALKGVDTLLLISSSEVGQRATQHQNVINAAKKASVKRIAYTSVLHADTSKLALAPEHLTTENAIKESGMDYTFLRNGWYTENYAANIPGVLQSGALIGSAGNGKLACATREDFAEAAAVVLTSDGHENKIYELAGDEAFTLEEYAAEISKQTAKDIPYNNLSESDYTDALVSVGIPEFFAKMLADSDAKAAEGALYSDDKTLSNLIGRATTPMKEVVKKFIN